MLNIVEKIDKKISLPFEKIKEHGQRVSFAQKYDCKVSKIFMQDYNKEVYENLKAKGKETNFVVIYGNVDLNGIPFIELTDLKEVFGDLKCNDVRLNLPVEIVHKNVDLTNSSIKYNHLKYVYGDADFSNATFVTSDLEKVFGTLFMDNTQIRKMTVEYPWFGCVRAKNSKVEECGIFLRHNNRFLKEIETDREEVFNKIKSCSTLNEKMSL